MPLHERSVRGVKRKRPYDKELEEDKEAKLRRKLHYALRELHKVAGKARTFEIQKTLKKLKDARRNDTESDVTKDLVAQMEILKYLDYDRLAESAFVTKLKKDKTLSVDPSIQAISVELASNLPSPATPGTPMAKVHGRILSSKVLASEVTMILETLRMFLHSPVRSEGIGIQKALNDTGASLRMSQKRRTGSSNKNGPILSEGGVVELSGKGRDETSKHTSGDGAIGEADNGWESGTVGTPSESGASVADDDEISSDSSEADFPSKDPRKPQSHGTKGQSEFLPSLSVGFIRGDSDGEFSDSGAKLVDGIKKNRRGQRARRAIWEKKFGKNANHVKKRRQPDTEHRQPGSAPVDRQSGWGNTSRRTLTQSRALSYHREQVPRPNVETPGGVRNSNSTKRLSDRRDDHPGKQGERPLHPWEAKKKQMSAGILPSQGTKVVFSKSS